MNLASHSFPALTALSICIIHLDGKYEIIHEIIPGMNSDEVIKFIKGNYENINIENHIKDFYINIDGTICIIIETFHANGDYIIIHLF